MASSEVPCADSSCRKKFSSEKNMRIHYKRKHTPKPKPKKKTSWWVGHRRPTDMD